MHGKYANYPENVPIFY